MNHSHQTKVALIHRMHCICRLCIFDTYKISWQMIILKFKILVAMWNLKPYQQTFCIQKLLAYRIVKKKKKSTCTWGQDLVKT